MRFHFLLGINAIMTFRSTTLFSTAAYWVASPTKCSSRLLRRQQLAAVELYPSLLAPTTTAARHRPAFYHSTAATTSRRSASSSSSSSSNNEEEIISLQASVSKSKSKSLTEDEHLKYQVGIFDTISDFFEKELTPELVPVYQEMAKDILSKMMAIKNKEEESDSSCHILDVACGTGVLWGFLIEAADQANIKLAITGVDLSPSMIDYASKRAKDLVKDNPQHQIETVQSDILEYCQKVNTATTSSSSSSFDGVILNACFGNFWGPRQVLEAIPGRTICISHPLGASFVQELHSKDPKTVPHVLPETTMQVLKLTHGLPLVLLSDPTTMTATPYYLTTLRKCRAKGLPQIHRYRGSVDQGYGRGGKKLGVPTANLPASLFQNALEDVATGVYFGWTALETNADQPDTTNSGVYKAVVNVGYSPTFEGQENPEKIIEAHLILDDDDEPLQDFYGVPMRLQLIGFLRDEKKFDSFPELIAQINADVQDAKDTLDWTPYQQLKDDDFLKTSSSSWIGSGGGDEAASWEFAPMMDTLQTIFQEDEKDNNAF